MRGYVVAMAMVWLAPACIYLEDLNYAPEVTVVPTSDGPYYRGGAIRLEAHPTDRNHGDVDQITLSWSLTDDLGAPLPSDASSSCTPAAAGCFVPQKLGVVYRMSVTATDPRGAVATAYHDFTVEDRPPTAALAVDGLRNSDGNYPLFGQLRFSAVQSDDPDAADVCALAYHFDLVRPLGSDTSKGPWVPCGAGLSKPGCTGDGPVWCLRPDAPGAYTVSVTVTDPSGLTAQSQTTVQVDPDAPPCLTQFVPMPIELIFASRSEGTRAFSVNVGDDLDPWPPASTNQAGFPAFTWSLQTAADPAPIPIPDYVGNHYELDLLAFSAGEQVEVRVDVRDREDRTATMPCAADAPVCPVGADPLSQDACVQRVTWTLEVY